MKKLSVGDIVYQVYGGSPKLRLTIERVTATQAVSGSFRFKIEAGNDGFVKKVTSERWDVYSYRIETPELISQWERVLVLARLKLTDWTKFSTDALKEIWAKIDSVK